MKAKIKDKSEIAEGTLRVVFEVLEEFPKFRAGQYFFITLPKLNYPDERGARRHFSIVNSPNEKGILTMTTRLSDSGFKKTLHDLPVGTEVEGGPIAGTFTLPEDLDRSLVWIAGGIGITPFMSMLKFIQEEKIAINILLIYSNRNQASTAYLSQVQEFAKIIPNLKLVLTMTEDPRWSGEKRMVDAEFIKEYTKDLSSPFFMVVGPPAMTEAVVGELKKIPVSEENIEVENFSGY